MTGIDTRPTQYKSNCLTYDPTITERIATASGCDSYTALSAAILYDVIYAVTHNERHLAIPVDCEHLYYETEIDISTIEEALDLLCSLGLTEKYFDHYKKVERIHSLGDEVLREFKRKAFETGVKKCL